jgi:hypothetical protein
MSKLDYTTKALKDGDTEYKPPFFERVLDFFKVPSIHMEKFEKLEDYFDLPKEDRLYKGLFYREPWGWPMNGFDDLFGNDGIRQLWKAEIRRRYPIQWFFREWLTSWDNPVAAFVKMRIIKTRDFCYNLRAWLLPWNKRTVRAARPFHYSDCDGLIESINEALLLDFYYEEFIPSLEVIDWDSTENQAQFVRELRRNVEILEADIPALKAEIDLVLDRGGEYKGLEQLEEEMESKKTKVFTWMIKNRGYFWT